MTIVLKKILIFLILVTLLVSLSAPATSIGTTMLGKVNGHVKDDLGQPVASCTVTLSDSAGIQSTATTDSNGYFSMTGTAGNTYSLNATKQYYQCLNGPADVKLSTSGSITKDLTMLRLPKTTTITADRYYVNADGSDAAWIYVQVLDANGQPISGHSVSIRLDKMGNEWYANEGHLWVDPPYLGVGLPLDANGKVSTKYGWVPPGGAGTSQTITVYWHYPDTKLGSVNIQIMTAPTPTPTPKPYTVNYTPPAVSAAFSASPVSGTAPLTVRFSDQSTGSPTSWSWSFGDSTSSTEASPTHTYTQPGTYHPELVVQSSASHTSSTKGDVTIVVSAPVGSQPDNNGVTVTPVLPANSNAGTSTPVGSQTSGQQVSNSDDSIPPVTEATLAGTQGSGMDVYTSDVQVILLANDGKGGGVQLTRYSLDGSNWSLYASPFTVSKDGTYTVFYYSVDNANNTEATHVKPFTIARQAKANLPCLNLLVLPLLVVGVIACARRKKGGR